jgi:hypothetical protein
LAARCGLQRATPALGGIAYRTPIVVTLVELGTGQPDTLPAARTADTTRANRKWHRRAATHDGKVTETR